VFILMSHSQQICRIKFRNQQIKLKMHYQDFLSTVKYDLFPFRWRISCHIVTSQTGSHCPVMYQIFNRAHLLFRNVSIFILCICISPSIRLL
jgi:hypothetical protein